MIHEAMFVSLIVLLLGPGCKCGETRTNTATEHDGLPAFEIEEALRRAREAAAWTYDVDLYTVDACVRDKDGWRITFGARPVDEVGAKWSRTQKEQWLAHGNHFSIYVYNDRTVRVIGGR